MMNGFNTSLINSFTNTGNHAQKTSDVQGFPVPTSSMPHTVLDGNALVSAGFAIPGGWLNASVFKSENFTSDNPVMLVKGTNTDGMRFEVEINANEVNPRNASFIEMMALDGYFASKGQSLGTTRAAASAMAIKEARGGTDGFSKFDFLPSLTEAMEVQRQNRNWEAFHYLQHIVDTLSRIENRFNA